MFVLKKFCLSMGLFMLAALVSPGQASAQGATRVVVSSTAAPVFVLPDSARVPLRTAKEGSVLTVIAAEDGWYRVEFQDQQWGRRVGYIEKRHVRVIAAPTPQTVDLHVQQPVDLTVPESRPAQSGFQPQQPQVTQTDTQPSTEIGLRLARARLQERGWVDVNVGSAQPAESVVTTVGTRTLFRETASFTNSYNQPRGSRFDFGGGYMFTSVIGLGMSFTGTANEELPDLGIRIPHPTHFDAHANDVGTGDAKLQRVETGINIQAMINATPTSDNLRVRVFAGPTFFRVKADTIDSVRYNQDFMTVLPIQVVDITGYQFSESEGTGWGVHAGADVSYFFSRTVGLGGAMSFSRGTVELADMAGPFKVKAGGLQTGVGFRLRF